MGIAILYSAMGGDMAPVPLSREPRVRPPGHDSHVWLRLPQERMPFHPDSNDLVLFKAQLGEPFLEMLIFFFIFSSFFGKTST